MSRPKSGPLALRETFGDLEHYGATPTALILPDETTIEECVEIGVRLGKLESASMFWIGDLLVHSEERFGEMASQIEEATGYARATISAAKYVCSHVKPENRLVGVSFAHHKAVAAVDEELQKHWLAEALKLGLPVDGVKAAIKDLQRMAGVTTQKKAGRKAEGAAPDERSEKPQKQTGRESAALARAAAKAAHKPGKIENVAENGSEGPASNGNEVAAQLDAMLESLTALRQAAADLDDVMVPTENMLREGSITYAQMATLLKQIGVFDTIKHLFLQSASAISVEALKQPNAANDEPLRGSGAIPYQPLGGGGEFSPKFEGFKPDTMARARPATDEELKLLDQPEGFADFMAELAKLKGGDANKPAKMAAGTNKTTGGVEKAAPPALTLEPAQLPLCAACGAPATRAFGRPSQPTSLKRFCQNHWLRDLKKDGNTEVHRGQMSGKAALAGREGNGGTADAGDGGERILDLLVPVQQGKGRKGKSAVSRDAGPDQAQLQKARSGDAGADRQLGFTILPHFFEEASLSAATAQYNALYDKVVQIGKLIERRRTGESASRCSFCKTEFGKGNHEYGVWTYEDPPGSGLKHQIRTCRSDQCVREYEKATNDIALRMRGVGR